LFKETKISDRAEGVYHAVQESLESHQRGTLIAPNESISIVRGLPFSLSSTCWSCRLYFHLGPSKKDCLFALL